LAQVRIELDQRKLHVYSASISIEAKFSGIMYGNMMIERM